MILATLAAIKPPSVSESTIAFVLLDTAVIIAVARLVGLLFKRIGQPPVIGEIIAGLLLGPSLLGSDWVTDALGLKTSLTVTLFPLEARPYLKVLAELGLVLFMFIVGLELDMKLIKGKERLAAGVSLTSVALPFVLGCGLAVVLDNRGYKPVMAEFLPFALFIGASMSVTAFPVLARVLSERRMTRTAIGVLALACAAIDDILAWSLLAVVTAVVQASLDSGGGGNVFGDLLKVLIPSIIFVVFMFVAVKPLLGKLLDRFKANSNRFTPEILAVILGGLLLSSWFTSKIGIHEIFGAFLFGAVMPREAAERFTHDLVERIETIAVLLLLPLFFIVTGLNVNVGTIDASGLAMLVLIVAVACIGKFVGATLAGRVQGLSMRRAAAVGTLMNTRGLTELVLLSIGLDKGVLSKELFTLLVLMAIITTVMTAPLLKKIYPDRMLNHDIAEAERAALGVIDAYRVLVLVEDPDRAATEVGFAGDLALSDPPGEVVLSRLRVQPDELDAGLGTSTLQLMMMAESLDDLHDLQGQVEGRGLTSAVFSQYTEDIVGDLAGQAERQLAKVVVVADDRDAADRPALLADLAARIGQDLCIVVAAASVGSPDGPIVIEGGPQPHGTAAFELGIRFSAATGRIPTVRGTDGKGRQARAVREAMAAVIADGSEPIITAEGLEPTAAPSAVFRDWVPAAGDADPLATARAEADRLGCPVVLVRSDPNQLDRTGVDDFVTRRLQQADA